MLRPQIIIIISIIINLFVSSFFVYAQNFNINGSIPILPCFEPNCLKLQVPNNFKYYKTHFLNPEGGFLIITTSPLDQIQVSDLRNSSGWNLTLNTSNFINQNNSNSSIDNKNIGVLTFTNSGKSILQGSPYDEKVTAPLFKDYHSADFIEGSNMIPDEFEFKFFDTPGPKTIFIADDSPHMNSFKTNLAIYIKTPNNPHETTPSDEPDYHQALIDGEYKLTLTFTLSI